jgi:glycosyltransferase involved in cell wall biosynthesis
MKILYLYTEIMGYQIPVFEELINVYGADLFVIHWDRQKLTPYIPPDIDHLHFYSRSTFGNHKSILEFCLSIQPDLVYISGWQDPAYLKVARVLKSKSIPIVIGFDDQWVGSFRQVIGSILMRFSWIRKYFTHAWVAGPYQFEYASRMGFSKRKIIFNLLSCDAEKFNVFKQRSSDKSISSSHQFLYVGNFREVKGTDILLAAFKIYRNKYCGNWGLTCIGNGELECLVEQDDSILRLPFSGTDALIDYSKKSTVFIMPSRHDQWGVAVHEFALTGLPLILSENVGSHPVFLIDGYNGYLFKNNSAEELAEKMYFISQKSDKELVMMGARSHCLGLSITPQITAASLMSVLR